MTVILFFLFNHQIVINQLNQKPETMIPAPLSLYRLIAPRLGKICIDKVRITSNCDSSRGSYVSSCLFKSLEVPISFYSCLHLFKSLRFRYPTGGIRITDIYPKDVVENYNSWLRNTEIFPYFLHCWLALCGLNIFFWLSKKVRCFII